MLLVCYAAAVLGINMALVTVHVIGHLWTRSVYSLGHVYIGQGQHAVLRLALGLIETLSGGFRSVSLSLRIVCNATAGHVLLAVLVEMTLSAYSHSSMSYYPRSIPLTCLLPVLHMVARYPVPYIYHTSRHYPSCCCWV